MLQLGPVLLFHLGNEFPNEVHDGVVLLHGKAVLDAQREEEGKHAVGDDLLGHAQL